MSSNKTKHGLCSMQLLEDCAWWTRKHCRTWSGEKFMAIGL